MSRTKRSICDLTEIQKLKLWAKHEQKQGYRYKSLMIEHVVTRMEFRKIGVQI